MYERFKAIPKSGHRCCFDASVIDTSEETPNTYCECFTMEQAEAIAKALNIVLSLQRYTHDKD